MQLLEVQPFHAPRKVGSQARIAARRRRSQAGFTLIEMIVAFSILLVLSTMAVPLARHQVRRQREKELLADLREMRAAIDRYKDLCDTGKLQPANQEAFCYPTT